MSIPQASRILTRAALLRIMSSLGSIASVVMLLTLFASETPARAQRVHILPKLHPGQILTYDVSYQSDKHVKTQSSFITATPANGETVDVHALLRLEILDVQPQGAGAAIHARARFEAPRASLRSEAPGSQPPSAPAQTDAPSANSVDFTLLRGGQVDNVKGLDALSPQQQQAWQEWVSRFALAMTLPASGVKIAQRWKSDEPETSPSPIAGLLWFRESSYVRNEPCSPANMTVQGDLVPADTPPDTCAVILTTATLKQHSSPHNSTPEAFQVRELRTTGSAHGKNRIITYISLKTGLIVRATEEANQNMDVTVAKADHSNRVHYTVAAKSHSEVLLVSGTPLSHADSH